MLTLSLPRNQRYRVTRGYGIGSIFSKLGSLLRPVVTSAIRSARPLAKSAVKEIGRTGLETLGNSLVDISTGVPMNEALGSNLQQGVNEVKGKVRKVLKRSVKKTVKKRQKGGGRKIRRRKQIGRGCLLYTSDAADE